MKWIAMGIILMSGSALAQDVTPGTTVETAPIPTLTEVSQDSSAEVSPTTYRLGIITALTVPQPLSVGLIAIPSYDPDLAFFIEGGYFRFGFGKSRVINDWSLMMGTRYQPFSNWFFCALEFGYRHVGVTADISSLQSDGEPLASSASLGLNAFFFGLIVGGQWKLSPNVSLGLDLGLQMAVVHWGDVAILADPATADDTDLSVDASDSMGRVASLPVPQIALLRFIWYL